jgi:hypothetical protein
VLRQLQLPTYSSCMNAAQSWRKLRHPFHDNPIVL